MSSKPAPKPVAAPFTVIVDTREQSPFTFDGLSANADRGGGPLVVPTRRMALEVGDYGILGLPMVVVERKSKADLYHSVGHARTNFDARLKRMCLEYAAAAVVVEAEWAEVLADPPAFTRYNPRSLFRTVLAWMIRWPRVQWIMMPGRDVAAAATFRFLERFWYAFREGKWFDHERFQEQFVAGDAGRRFIAQADFSTPKEDRR